MTENKTFEHAGIKIEINDHAEFTARVNGRFVRKRSLAAMKKHIDEVNSNHFTPFNACVLAGWRHQGDDDGLVPVQVIGREKTGSRGVGYRHVWRIQGHQETARVMADTPENRAAYRAHIEFDKETSRIQEERRKKAVELREAVIWLEADDYKAEEKP